MEYLLTAASETKATWGSQAGAESAAQELAEERPQLVKAAGSRVESGAKESEQREGKEKVTAGELAAEIKQLQRSDPNAKQAWRNYCDMNLNGIKDPSRHDEVTLNTFMEFLNSGATVPAAARRSAPGTMPKGGGKSNNIIGIGAPRTQPTTHWGSGNTVKPHGKNLPPPMVNCVYWSSGKCRSGLTCQFKHDTPTNTPNTLPA